MQRVLGAVPVALQAWLDYDVYAPVAAGHSRSFRPF